MPVTNNRSLPYLSNLIHTIQSKYCSTRFGKSSFALIQDQLNFTPLPKQSTINQPDIEQKLTTYHQDDFGNTIQVDSPTTGITTYQYNTANQLIASQNALRATSLPARDKAGRIIDLIINEQGQSKHHRIVWGKTNKPIQLIYPEGR